MNKFYKIILLLKRIKYRLRAKYYGLFYKIGKNCSFEKIKFREPSTRKMGKDSIIIGRNVIFYQDVVLTAFNNFPIIIGDSSFINQRCILGPGTIIGSNVSLGHQVSLITATHKIGQSHKRAGEAVFLPIHIEDGCWIGANSTILGGITIGKGCIIAAGAVVNKDCESDSLYGGVPARFIKKL